LACDFSASQRKHPRSKRVSEGGVREPYHKGKEGGGAMERAKSGNTPRKREGEKTISPKAIAEM